VIEADGFGAFASNRSITDFADSGGKRNLRRVYTKVSSRKAVIVKFLGECGYGKGPQQRHAPDRESAGLGIINLSRVVV
jgi:hypothetical protein